MIFSQEGAFLLRSIAQLIHLKSVQGAFSHPVSFQLELFGVVLLLERTHKRGDGMRVC